MCGFTGFTRLPRGFKPGFTSALGFYVCCVPMLRNSMPAELKQDKLTESRASCTRAWQFNCEGLNEHQNSLISLGPAQPDLVGARGATNYHTTAIVEQALHVQHGARSQRSKQASQFVNLTWPCPSRPRRHKQCHERPCDCNLQASFTSAA